MDLKYTPPPTLEDFHLSDDFCRFVIGPLGSGKTFSMIMELMRRAFAQQPDVNGVRWTRWAVIRNTLPQLKQTVLPDIQQVLRPIVRFKVAESTIYINESLDDGTKLKVEILLMPIETKEDQRRLLSLQLTGAWLAEFRELNYDTVAAVMGRVGRFPSKAVGGCTWEGVFGESNPFSDGSDWHEHLVLNLPNGWSFWQQPGGLDDEAENRENLPDDYYERLMDGHSEEWIKVHVHGKFGDDLSGQAVFNKTFIPGFHLVKGIEPQTERPLLLGADWGRTPAALIGQVDNYGRLNIFKEVTAVDVGVEQFAARYLTPELLTQRFLGLSHHLIGDPAGRSKGQMGEESIFDILFREGFSAVPAPTNDIDPRLRAVERLFLRQIDGGPAIRIDPDGCPMLVRALGHEYKYRRKKTGDIEELPSKTHPWSDLADALQYLCLGMDSAALGRVMRGRPKWDVQAPPSAAGWT